MAQQCGPLFLECTWDDLTFYKMDGKYYARSKSRLTRNRVLTHPDFAMTMAYARLLATASKIAASIYSDLPINWRQYWMFRSFTGEALTMMDAGATPQQAYDYLWVTYVQYWVLYQHATGIPLQTGRKTPKPRRPKTYKTRLKHRTANEKCRRYKTLIGRNHWKSSYDNTAELLEKERKRLARLKKQQWIEEQRAKGRWKAEEEQWERIRHLLMEPPPTKGLLKKYHQSAKNTAPLLFAT